MDFCGFLLFIAHFLHMQCLMFPLACRSFKVRRITEKIEVPLYVALKDRHSPAIPHAIARNDVFRSLFLSKQLSGAVDMLGQGIILNASVVSLPGQVFERFARTEYRAVGGQVQNQIVLGGRELDQLSVFIDLSALFVHNKISGLDDAVAVFLFLTPRTGRPVIEFAVLAADHQVV